MGTETEYGLFIEGVDLSDMAAEARALIGCYGGPFAAPWDYAAESPMRDLRGFRAPGLSYNPRDIVYEKPSERALSSREDHVDRVLSSGARLYHDHGHPEFSTPECLSLWDLIAHERAGERIIWACAQAYAKKTGHPVSIYKNNTDFHGMSYGAHENYLVGRKLPFEQLCAGLVPFLVTRILYAGAGKVGLEEEVGADSVSYQLSQRADFFAELASVDTLNQRPLVNTRDEPHADANRYRRLHVIAGDANMSEYALALKLGTTVLTLDILEAGYGPPVTLRDPLQALKALSRAASNSPQHWHVETEEDGVLSAIEIQRAYQMAASEIFAGRDDEDEVGWVLREWARVLDALEADPLGQLSDRLDWVAKRHLLDAFIEEEKLDWKRDRELLQSLDLAYHDLDPARGLYWGLLQEGRMRRLVAEEAIERAREQPPADTRAGLRGLCVRRFASQIESLSWGQVNLSSGGKRVILDMSSLVDGRLTALNSRLAAEGDRLRPKELAELVKQSCR
jgi:proteasome accessory factor A